MKLCEDSDVFSRAIHQLVLYFAFGSWATFQCILQRQSTRTRTRRHQEGVAVILYSSRSQPVCCTGCHDGVPEREFSRSTFKLRKNTRLSALAPRGATRRRARLTHAHTRTRSLEPGSNPTEKLADFFNTCPAVHDYSIPDMSKNLGVFVFSVTEVENCSFCRLLYVFQLQIQGFTTPNRCRKLTVPDLELFS